MTSFLHPRDRSEIVKQAIKDKFVNLSAPKDAATPWTNMGKADEKIYLREGKNKEKIDYVSTKEIIKKNLVGSRETKFLDLGTGNGSLLDYIHTEYCVPYSRLHGITALDHRTQNSTIPNSSYKILNIDELHEDDQLQSGSFCLITSSCTFYHLVDRLVDPLGALVCVYDLLHSHGLAIIRHVPIMACCVEVCDMEELLGAFNSFWKREGFEALVTRMEDSPGNCMVTFRRTTSSPDCLKMPVSYTGGLVIVGGYGSYAAVELMNEVEIKQEKYEDHSIYNKKANDLPENSDENVFYASETFAKLSEVQLQYFSGPRKKITFQ